MNYLKTICIATILLNLHVTRAFEYPAYTQEEPANLEETAEPISTEEPQQEIPTSNEVQEENIVSATAEWNNHLTELAEPGQYWNVNSNIPTDSWKDKAFRLAKEALNDDKTISETIKSTFFNAITAKIKQENGEFTASTYALIKEFNDVIDAYVNTLTEPETEQVTPVVEEIKEEPAPEQPAPIEIEDTSVPTEQVSQPETTATESSPDLTAQWNNILEEIKHEGSNSSEIKALFTHAYDIARKLWLQELMDQDSLQFDFEYAINRHNQNKELLPINLKNALEAFNKETGIPIIGKDKQTQELQEKYIQARKKRDEQEERHKKELKEAAAIQQALQQARISEGEMQRLNKRLQDKLAADDAARNQEQADLQAEIQRIRQELADIRKKEKEPEKETGIFGAIKRWWYGESQETTTQDNQELLKLQELLNTMASTPNQRQEIEKNWQIFTQQLQSFKDIDTSNTNATQKWLNDIKKALRVLTLTYHILSVDNALTIINNNIKEYPNSKKVINDIQYFLETPAREKKQKEEQEKNIKEQREQRRNDRKNQKLREQQQIKDEENQKQAYKNAKEEWKNFLKQISRNRYATPQDNNKYTTDATQKAGSLINLAALISPEKRHSMGQKVKQKFAIALLEQQKDNESHLNIHKNMDQFNNAINKMID